MLHTVMTAPYTIHKALFGFISSILHVSQSSRLEASPEISPSVANPSPHLVALTLPSMSPPPLPLISPSRSFALRVCVSKRVNGHRKPSDDIDGVIPSRLSAMGSALAVLAVVNGSLMVVVQPLVGFFVCFFYRPISQLPLLLKILEKHVPILNKKNIFERLQPGQAIELNGHFSGFLMTVFSASDSGKAAILVLLDPTTAFNKVDAIILISSLEHWIGIKKFHSHLAERFFFFFLCPPLAPLPCYALQDFFSPWSTSVLFFFSLCICYATYVLFLESAESHSDTVSFNFPWRAIIPAPFNHYWSVGVTSEDGWRSTFWSFLKSPEAPLASFSLIWTRRGPDHNWLISSNLGDGSRLVFERIQLNLIWPNCI